MNSSRRVKRVLFAGTWDEGPGYPRTTALIDGLRTTGVEVDTVRVPLPAVAASKSRVLRSPWKWPWLALGLWRARRELRGRTRSAVAAKAYDAVVVPYPGHLAVSWVRGVVDVPVVLDLFLSAHGTVVEDRKLFAPGSIVARLLAWLDRRACGAADIVLLDTPQHADQVCALTDESRARFDWVPVSVPVPAVQAARCRRERAELEVLFFGTGVSLHGLTTLCDAVAASDTVRLTLVGGTDAERRHARSVIPSERLELGAPFEPPLQIADRIGACDLVAGIFGSSPKAQAVIPFKLVHALAAQRPVLTADTPAVRALLRPGVDCLVCPGGDAAELAKAMQSLVRSDDLLVDVAVQGRARYDETFSSRAVGLRLVDVLGRACHEEALP